MPTDGLRLIEAESTMADLAVRATEVQTQKAARLLVMKLVNSADYYFDDIADFEPGATPTEVARDILVSVTQDERVILGGTPPESIDPNDAYSCRLARRQFNLPRALGILEGLQTKVSA